MVTKIGRHKTVAYLDVIRALVAAQVAVLEHAEEPVGEHGAIDAIDRCLKEATRLARHLRRQAGE